MIDCEWEKIKDSAFSNNEEKKTGRYSGCVYPIKGYGVTSWAVHGYLKLDWQKHLDEGLSKREIVDECLEFLNQVPPRKKYQKKESKPKFGKLEAINASWADCGYEVKFDDNRLIVSFLTDDRKNKNFWGEGYNQASFDKLPKKRGRKKKEKK